MAMQKKAADMNVVIEVPKQDYFIINIVGTTPFIYNRMLEKAKRELLFPSGRKTAADKAAIQKHDPLAEFRNSVYHTLNDCGPTRFNFPAIGFKKALSTAALDMPSTRKTQIGRLTRVEGDAAGRVPIWGAAHIFMAIVRNSDINHTPDVRTRALLRKWATRIKVHYTTPLIKHNVVVNLLATAGMTVGVGDFRQEKGTGDYGHFRLCDEDDPEFLDVIKNGGREAQDMSMQLAEPHDDETTEMLSWFIDESARRAGKPRPSAEQSERPRMSARPRMNNGAGTRV